MNAVGPVVGQEDVFEGIYTEKFRSLVRDYGEFVKFERDRAALDLGLQFTTSAGKHRRVSHTRIWFQFKGIHKETLSLDHYTQAATVRIPLSINHLQFWFASPEPIYIALYVECVDKFLVEDVRDIVYRTWGEDFLNPNLFPPGQKTVTIEMNSSAVLNPDRLDTMRRHKSMSVDGPYFRGRPLGHRLDPLRCSLNRVDPTIYESLVNRLLAVHGYRPSTDFVPGVLFQEEARGNEHVALTTGLLYNTFEWVPQLSTEFGYDIQSDFREEGSPQYAHGLVAVLIDSNPQVVPDPDRLQTFSRILLDSDIRRMLVFANTDDYGYFGAFFGGLRNSRIECMPQLLGDLSFSLLTTTMVYLEFREYLSWKIANFLD